MNRFTLVYDSGCGPCTRFKNAVKFLDAYHRLEGQSLLDADRDGLLDEVPVSRRHRSFHLVFPGGEVLSGADALPELIRLLPSGGMVAGLVYATPVGRWSMAFVYSTFVRLHDSGSCEYRPPRTGKRPATLAADFTLCPVAV